MGAAIEEIIDVEAEAALEATRPPAIGWSLPAELFLWARFRRAAAKDEADDVDVVLIEAAEVTIAEGGRGGATTGGALAVNKLHFLRRHFVLIPRLL